METTLAKPIRKFRSLTPFWTTQMDRLLRNDVFTPWDGGFVDTTPSLNIREEKNDFIIDLAAPGLKRDDFDIKVDGDILTISSNKKTEIRDDNYTCREYDFNSFSRTIILPDYVDSNKIVAKYNDGILNLTIPQKPEAHKLSQKIKVH